MRRVREIAYMLLTAVLLTVSALTPMETKAGESEILLDAESLVTSDWHNPEGDVVVEEGKLIFSTDSTDYTRFIAKSPAKLEEKAAALVTLAATFEFDKLPQDKSFILGFGLSGIESVSGEAGNIEVVFSNNGGVKLSVIAYNDEGNPETLVSPKNCGFSLGKKAKVYVKISTDSQMTISVNNQEICSISLPVSGEGRVGFLQTGECSVVVSDVELKHYEYSSPENTNISEDFETGAMDVSKLTARMIYAAVNHPTGQVVQEYNGSQVLMHINTGAAYVGTLYKYSNFEMTFDVPYLNLKREFNDDGSIQKVAFGKLAVALGGERADWDGIRYDLAAETVVFEPGVVYSYSNRENCSADMAKNPFAGEGKPFSVKVTMIDGILSVGMKWLEEKSFNTVLEYKIKGGTPTGHLHIWAPQGANFAIDNLKITNLDKGANLIETEYKSGKLQVPESKAPEALERVYAETDGAKFSWYLLIPISAVAGGGVLGITALTTRKKKNKEAITDEQ